MDKKTLVDKLVKFFFEINFREKKYAEVWLSDVDFGGLYSNDMYVLHVRPMYKYENYTEEIMEVFDLLGKNAKEILQGLWSVKIHSHDEKTEKQSDFIPIYPKPNTDDAVAGYINPRASGGADIYMYQSNQLRLLTA